MPGIVTAQNIIAKIATSLITSIFTTGPLRHIANITTATPTTTKAFSASNLRRFYSPTSDIPPDLEVVVAANGWQTKRNSKEYEKERNVDRACAQSAKTETLKNNS